MKAGGFVFLFYLFISVCNSFAAQIVKTCPIGSTGGTKYEISDDKLTYVNPDIYLESTGTQYIKTDFVPTQNTRVVAKIEVTGGTDFNWIFGVIDKTALGKQSCYGLAIHGRRFYSEISGTNTNYGNVLLNNNVYNIDFTVTLLDADKRLYHTGATTLIQSELPMYIFANNNAGTTYDSRFIGRIYYLQVYESDTLVHNFVPVPAGIQIGDFTVPSNGMWDMVGQKFYENAGTGDFVYEDRICRPCPSDTYYDNSDGVPKCVACPTGYTDDIILGKTSISECKILCVGGYVATPYDSTCTAAGVGNWAPQKYVAYGQTSSPEKCPDGMLSSGFGLASDEISDCGRVLWVNNSPIYAGSVKKTTPSLNIRVADKLYYASMTPVYNLRMDYKEWHDDILYVNYNDVDYVVHDDSLFSYSLDAGGAYLESTGGQYIDLGYYPTENTRIHITLMDTDTSTNYHWVFGNIDRENFGKTSCFGLGEYRGYFYSEIGGGNTQIAPMDVNTKYSVIFTVPELYYLGQWVSTGGQYGQYKPINYPMYMFANNNAGTTYDARFIGRIYNFQIYESDTLVHNFVPVPAGMKINDFSVPSNGMWDTIGQQFYGNVGTGNFIYGIDGD